MQQEPPAPLHLHDICDLLNNHAAAPPPHTYDSLRQLFSARSFQAIHSARPRPLARLDWQQHLFQACILFIRRPQLARLLHTSLLAVQPPPVHNLDSLLRNAAFFLLVLLHATQPPPALPIRIDEASVALIEQISDTAPHGHLLLNHLLSNNGLVLVAQLRHGPSPAPTHLSSSATGALHKRWTPHALYGYQVPLFNAKQLLASDDAIVLGKRQRPQDSSAERDIVCEQADGLVADCRALSTRVFNSPEFGIRRLAESLPDAVKQYDVVRKEAMFQLKANPNANIPVLDLFDERFPKEIADIAEDSKPPR